MTTEAYPLLPATAYVKTWDTAEAVTCGSFDTQDHTDLGHIRLLLYKHGTHGGTERIRLKVYKDSGLTLLLATSEWSALSDITNLSTYWWGWLRFDFARQIVNKLSTYYLQLETENYTRNADTYYLSHSLDWPVPQNTQLTAGRPSAAIQIFGYRDLSL
jgi:hypothetical protein